jgi:putative SOS response-associated peptidase YedK
VIDMCGRFSLDRVEEIFELRRILSEIGGRLGPDALLSIKTGEIFPTDSAAVIRQAPEGDLADVLRWGYPLRDGRNSLINARSETMLEKPLFSHSIPGKRCLVPATGFFEWQSAGKTKQKYRIRIRGTDYFYLAGLWEEFTLPGGIRRPCFVILTAAAEGDMTAIHERVPVIARPENKDIWLHGDPQDALRQLKLDTGDYLPEAV